MRKLRTVLLAISISIALLALTVWAFWPIFRSVYLVCRSTQGVSSIPVLIGALGDKSELSSAVAMSHLASFGAAAARDVSALVADKTESHHKRAKAAECLARMLGRGKGTSNREVVAALRLGASDENDDVRVYCLSALWRYESNWQEVVPGLISLLSSSENRVVYEAISTLEEIGPPAQSALEPLLQLGEANPLFATDASYAILAIRGKQQH